VETVTVEIVRVETPTVETVTVESDSGDIAVKTVAVETVTLYSICLSRTTKYDSQFLLYTSPLFVPDSRVFSSCPPTLRHNLYEKRCR